MKRNFLERISENKKQNDGMCDVLVCEARGGVLCARARGEQEFGVGSFSVQVFTLFEETSTTSIDGCCGAAERCNIKEQCCRLADNRTQGCWMHCARG